MKFEPGVYYVGDPGFVIPSNDLRMLFGQATLGCLKTGPKEIEASYRVENNKYVCDFYWLAVMPNKQGTLYDQNGNAYGFDWGCFGVVPWKWLDINSSYESNKIEFTSPFECFSTEDDIKIGHLHFTFNPK